MGTASRMDDRGDMGSRWGCPRRRSPQEAGGSHGGDSDSLRPASARVRRIDELFDGSHRRADVDNHASNDMLQTTGEPTAPMASKVKIPIAEAQSQEPKRSRARTTVSSTETPRVSVLRVSSSGSPAAQFIRQSETRPISQEQLVAEVKGIYADLVMVESKCIVVDNAQSSQSSQSDTKLNNEQWQALIALHRTLLHEHHDFFLASQHPSASPALRRLASKYAMPARMWRHGIHSFLELLRHRLPASSEHMLSFIYLAYSMMALLYETVPASEDTWVECLGDLGRYRMAIEEDDKKDREVWTSVSRHWYSKASDKAPNIGRLYHHLAILARPNALQQLFYYTKSLCVPIPFISARESIMALFDPVTTTERYTPSSLNCLDLAFIKAHGTLFGDTLNRKDDSSAVAEFLENLDDHIGRTTRRWLDSGCFTGMANCCALLSYGNEDNAATDVNRSLQHGHSGTSGAKEDAHAHPSDLLEASLRLAQTTNEIVLQRSQDPDVLPYLHAMLVFQHHLTQSADTMATACNALDWTLITQLLNSLLLSCHDYEHTQCNTFPTRDKEPAPRPLPEDFAMRGLLWAQNSFPEDWFSNENIDDDEKYFEVASMTNERRERILWFACQIANRGRRLTYGEERHTFDLDGGTVQYRAETHQTRPIAMISNNGVLRRAEPTKRHIEPLPRTSRCGDLNGTHFWSHSQPAMCV
ncbi:hypothetical protein F4778DRAFT_357381 [Xylariomycetidae sp. FL2044]|nr:hypothetical protein F4778DRAFT_357381 [Xylariomycetidae sp. FL2044]